MSEAKIFEFPGRPSWPQRGKRILTPEQREKRRELSRRPRRSKNGTPGERAAKTAGKEATSSVVTDPTKTRRRREAELVRGELMVELLSKCFIREGWDRGFDKIRAERFLECLRTFDRDDGNDQKFTEIIAWVSDHEQSLDWLFTGDVGGMITRLASHSLGRRRVPVLEEV